MLQRLVFVPQIQKEFVKDAGHCENEFSVEENVDFSSLKLACQFFCIVLYLNILVKAIICCDDSFIDCLMSSRQVCHLNSSEVLSP